MPGAAKAGRQPFTWYYLRVTGLLMVVLVLVHLFLMHYASAPSATTSAFVAGRWSPSAGWRLFDWTLLALALTHGIVGVQGILREAFRGAAARAAVDLGGGAAALIFLVLGTAAVVAGAPPDRTAGPLSSAGWIPAALIAGLTAVATATYAGIAAAAGALVWRLVRREPLGRWSYAGQWAFALNRIAGAGILGFLLLHVVDVALVPFAPALYDRTVAAYAMPYLVPMEAGLVAAVVYHALDGLRLIALEILDRRAADAAPASFVAILVVTVTLSLPALAVLLGWRP